MPRIHDGSAVINVPSQVRSITADGHYLNSHTASGRAGASRSAG